MTRGYRQLGQLALPLSRIVTSGFRGISDSVLSPETEADWLAFVG